ncbi:MAG: type II secretion system F family protein [Pirellulaceae bacterium]|nr:type II secretion system F family protein [Pirellulaceae bacterium]
MISQTETTNTTALKPLTLEHQLILCEQIAALANSGMPLERGLAPLVKQLPKSLGDSSRRITDRLAKGQSLSKSLAEDNRPTSRSLHATVEAGIAGNCLAPALRSWIAIHTEQGRFRSRLRAALVYPLVLTLVAAFSLGYTIYHSIPLYQSAFESLHAPLPFWFDWLLVLHRTLWVWTTAMAALCIMLLVWSYRMNTVLAPSGMPRNRAYQMQLQAHATRLMTWMIEAKRPFDPSYLLAIEATGIRPQTETIDTLNRLNTKIALGWNPISKECQTILRAVEKGDLSFEDSKPSLLDLTDQLNLQAARIAERQAKFIPVIVSIFIGVVVVGFYVVVVYLPWVQLLTRLSVVK